MNALIPAVQAIADRLTWEGAILRHLLATLPPDALDRPAGSTGWMVRQVFAHVADNEGLHADMLERFLGGGVARPDGFDIDAWNASTVAARAAATPEEIVERLATERERLFALFAKLDETAAAAELGPGRSVADALGQWAGHFAGHAWDILGAVPEIRGDPLVLDWILGIDYGDATELAANQRALLAELRESNPTEEPDAP